MTQPIRRAGMVVHTGRPAAVDAAIATAGALRAEDVEVVLLEQDADDLPLDELATTVDRDGFVEDTDVVLSFGGDGTFLRAAHRCRDACVPILGVNLGRVGFLAEVEMPALDDALGALVAGSYRIEERATVEAVVLDADDQQTAHVWALNDVSIEKTARQRLLLMELEVGDELFATVPADAMVLATPTGSTAYSLSAGGPILSPAVTALVVTPVAPHSLFDRTIVTGPGEQVRVHVLPEQAPAVLSVDGREPVPVPAGGSVRAGLADVPVRLVRVDPPHFYELVRRKFSLR